MLQLTQNLKSGTMELLEVPFPALSKGYVLVRNHFSLISAGTEGGKVKTARKGYIGKAKEKPEQVKQVLDSIKTEGLIPTYKKVMNKLDAPVPLGYSCAGEVIKISKGISEFKIGDYVACGGNGACHADVVSVPKNLCVKIPSGVKIEHAAYSTIASIALQGIRQADLHLGETCTVIGLGLIGQLTIQMLKVAGVNVVGIDINEGMVEFAKKSGANLAINRSDDKLENAILEFSGGHGVDSVIITAGTNSLDPVELAGRLCRKKGKVIIVGTVPTGFSRENYYKKELELRMSCSYGPGRYDTDYEEKGVEYPIGYVRWTENRNMQAFLQMVASGKLNIDLLTTHIFDFKDAKKAYQMILDRSEPYVGILLKYNIDKEIAPIVKLSRDYKPKKDAPNVGFIGAGSFAQKFLLPIAEKYGNMIGVATASGNDTRNIADKYGFNYATGNGDDIINDENINTVFIATRHNLHFEFVLKGLRNGKHIFVEKPLCMTEQELEEIKQEYEKQNVHLMVGFNRRFAPHIQKIKELFSENQPKAVNYRINAGFIPKDHWIQDKDIGGGRIIGEVCHFVDLAMFIAGAQITDISANVMDDANNLMDTLIINLSFTNGSVAAISYFSNGCKVLRKEYLEVYSAGMTAIVDDFKELRIYGKKVRRTRLLSQNKGHAKEVELFLKSIKNGEAQPIPFQEIYLSTLATFKVIESIKTKSNIAL
ncbi:MAG: bi-domain-containing oxidoreductase [Candidatus Marinimicrobia bacterium]|nr:bi-domain-containing oxidoreductase [candidate division WOR-3 bacterium]MCK4445834.1 bi-domain-containing oxidoreductase [Candidatus Neomarinimicrobiota bacterium]